eukprot:gene1837-6668_t
MSGRLPYHVNQINLWGGAFPGSAIPTEMATIPRKLKQAGYHTHMLGKWHCGMASHAHTPHGRGFDTSLGYFEGAEDHFTACQCPETMCSGPNNAYTYERNSSAGNRCALSIDTSKGQAASPMPLRPGTDTIRYSGTGFTDLWATDRPAYGINGTEYNGYIFTREAVRIITAHPAADPLFIYFAAQNNHAPLQVPEQYALRYPASQNWARRVYNGMTSFWDESVGNITRALKGAGLWADTLMIMSGDNGGPVYWTDIGHVYPVG